MFTNLRVNTPFYIFHKDATPYVETGSVMSVTAPMPNVGTTIGQPTFYTVDVTVKINDRTTTFQKLPANAEIADFGGNGNMVVATSREAMNGELSAMRQRSVEIIKSVPFHENMVSTLDKIIQELNPEEAEKAAQQAELTLLKQQVNAMSQNMESLIMQNRELMEQLKSSGTSNKSKKE